MNSKTCPRLEPPTPGIREVRDLCDSDEKPGAETQRQGCIGDKGTCKTWAGAWIFVPGLASTVEEQHQMAGDMISDVEHLEIMNKASCDVRAFLTKVGRVPEGKPLLQSFHN